MFLRMFSFFNFSGKKSSQSSTITGTASALQNPASLGKVQSVHLSMGSHHCQNSEIANSNWNNFEILFCKKVTELAGNAYEDKATDTVILVRNTNLNMLKMVKGSQITNGDDRVSNLKLKPFISNHWRERNSNNFVHSCPTRKITYAVVWFDPKSWTALGITTIYNIHSIR